MNQSCEIQQLQNKRPRVEYSYDETNIQLNKKQKYNDYYIINNIININNNIINNITNNKKN